MTFSRTAIVVFILTLWGTCFSALLAPAAEPPRPVAIPPFADPQVILDRLFGEEGEEDKKALAEIKVSLNEERQVGELAVRAYLADLRRRQIRVVSRGRDVEYLRALVEVIRPLMSQTQRYPTIKVYVAQSSPCEARSFPGGTLVFFRGLLEVADSEAAVVGVVGHELSHLDRGHQLLRVRRMKLAEETFSDNAKGFSAERFFTAGPMMVRMFTRPFRPEDEAEADRDGARWAYHAGYDPRGMASLFLKLRQRNKNQPASIPSFLRTHPLPGDRHKAVLSLYDQLQQAQPNDQLYLGKKNLRRRVARAQHEFDE